MTRIEAPIIHGTKRPKVARKRTNDRTEKQVITEYILNRDTQAQQLALAQLEALYAGEPVTLVFKD